MLRKREHSADQAVESAPNAGTTTVTGAPESMEQASASGILRWPRRLYLALTSRPLLASFLLFLLFMSIFAAVLLFAFSQSREITTETEPGSLSADEYEQLEQQDVAEAPDKILTVSGTVVINDTLSLNSQAVDPTHAVRADRLITAGAGLSGGGDLTDDRTLSINYGALPGTVVQGDTTITLEAGAGLSGGGTLTLGEGGSVSTQLASTPVTPGTYGSSVQIPTFTVSQQGRITQAGTTAIDIGALGAFVQGGNSFGEQAALGTTDAHALTLHTNDAERFRITSNGDVGIGTTNPSRKFHVAGGILSDSLGVAGGVATLGQDGSLGQLVLHDGATGRTGTLQVGSPLGQNTVYTIPDPGAASDEICLVAVGNCAGSGGGVTSSGGTANRIAKFTAGQNIEDSSLVDDGVTLGIDAGVDVNIDTGSLFVDSGNDRVGIGTTTPASALEVVGSGSFTGTVSGAEAVNQDDFTTLSQLQDQDVSGSAFLQGGNSFGATATLGTNDTNDLAFETDGAEAMRILANGNVGVGTNNPQALFEIAQPGQSSSDGLLVSQDGDNISLYTGLGGFQRLDFSDGFLIGHISNDDPSDGTIRAGRDIILNASNQGAGFGVNFDIQGNTQMRVEENGVGIGNTSPTEGLTLGSDGTTRNLLLSREDTATSTTQYSSNDITLQGSVWDETNTVAEDREITLRVEAGSGTDGSEPYRLAVRDNTGTEFATFDGMNQRVGIGTNTPGPHTLHVNSINNADNTYIARFDRGTTNDTIDIQATGVFGRISSGSGFTDGFQIHTQNGPLRFFTQDTEHMHLDASGNLGVGTVNPSEQLHLDEGSLLVTGTQGGGSSISVTGAGTRMFFNPHRAAFRAGDVNGNQWDDTNVGDYSTAFGLNTTASDSASTAFGSATTASGIASTAFGQNTTASGDRAAAFGQNTTASGNLSTVFGASSTASGDFGTAFGANTTASGLASTTFGQGIEAAGTYSFGIALNDQTGTTISQDSIMAIMGGQLGLGTTAPAELLHMTGGNLQVGSINNAWDLSAASYDDVSLDVSGEDNTPRGLVFSPDGTRLYMVGDENGGVNQYSLSTAWHISTASFDHNYSASGQYKDIEFNDDGTTMYLLNSGSDDVQQFTLSTAWDVSSATDDNVSFSVQNEESTPLGLDFSTDGTKMYVGGNFNSNVHQYTLSTAWDLSTASYDSVSFDTSSEDSSISGLDFRSDGTEMYIAGLNNNSIYQYTLSTAWDISSASFTASHDISSQITVTMGLDLNSTGTKMYVGDNDSDAIYQYSLGDTTGDNTYITGNLGIGTTTPASALEVVGSGSFTGTVSGAEAVNQDDFTTLSQLQDQDVSGSAFLQGGNSFGATATLGTNDTNDLAFETGGTEQLRINTAGNVGIGTSSPNTALDLQGAFTARGISAPSASPSGQGRVYFDSTDNKLKVSEDTQNYVNLLTPRTATVTVAASDSTNKQTADYIADGTSDQVTINNAIADLPASGGDVYLMEGLYVVDGSIELPSHTKLHGAGSSTVIKVKDAHDADLDVIVNSDPTGGNENITISNLFIDGNMVNQNSGEMYAINLTTVGGSNDNGHPGAIIKNIDIVEVRGGAIYTTDLYHSRISDISIWDTQDTTVLNIHSTEEGHNSIVNNSIRSTYTDDPTLYVDGGGYNDISNNQIVGNKREGIQTNSPHNLISNNLIKSNGVSSRSLHINGAHNTATGNSILDGNAQGVCACGEGLTLADNLIKNSSIQGVVVQADDITVANNTIRDAGDTAISVSNQANTRITGNVISNTNSQAAISINSGATDTYLADNTYEGSADPDIIDDSSTTVYASQQVDEDLILHSSGNVGIGTTNPTEGLTLGSDGTTRNLLLSREDTATSTTQYSSNDITLQGSVWDETNTVAENREIMLRVEAGSGTDGNEPYRLAVRDNTGTEFATFDGMNQRVGIGTTSPNAMLEVAGDANFRYERDTATSDAMINRPNQIIGADSSGGAITLTLASSLLEEGAWIAINDEGGVAATNTIKIATEGSETIDGEVTQTIANDNQGVVIYTDGTEWYTRSQFSGGSVDYAEFFGTRDASLAPGEIVVADATYTPKKRGQADNKAYVARSTRDYQKGLMGIVSTSPHEVIGRNLLDQRDNPRPIALSGRVPLRVTDENGAIEVGDYITSSSTPGAGMRATTAGPVVGRALEAYGGAGEGNIIVLVDNTYYNPATQASTQAGSGDVEYLQNGDRAVFSQLNVSGNTSLQGDLRVQGDAVFEGSVRVDKLDIETTLAVGGRIISRGERPDITPGQSLEPDDSDLHQLSGNYRPAEATIAGTDTAGTITVKTNDVDPGAGSDGGYELAVITLQEAPQDDSVLRLSLTPMNEAAASVSVYGKRSSDGFRLVVPDGLRPNAVYTFDYMVINTRTRATEAP